MNGKLESQVAKAFMILMLIAMVLAALFLP